MQIASIDLKMMKDSRVSTRYKEFIDGNSFAPNSPGSQKMMPQLSPRKRYIFSRIGNRINKLRRAFNCCTACWIQEICH